MGGPLSSPEACHPFLSRRPVNTGLTRPTCRRLPSATLWAQECGHPQHVLPQGGGHSAEALEALEPGFGPLGRSPGSWEPFEAQGLPQISPGSGGNSWQPQAHLALICLSAVLVHGIWSLSCDFPTCKGQIVTPPLENHGGRQREARVPPPLALQPLI